MSATDQKKKKSVKRNQEKKPVEHGQLHINTTYEVPRQTDSALVRIANGIAAFLFLDRDKLLDKAVEILGNCSVDVRACDVNSAINRIYDILSRSEYWDDSYVGSYFSYYYASAIVAWLYLHSKLGGLALPCSDDIAHAIVMMLSTFMAKFVSGAVRRCKERHISEAKAV